MAQEQYLSTQEACAALSISAPTLYAYVSRGLIRSESAGGKTRARRYAQEDVQRLKDRKELRRDPTKIATLTADALHWGTPLLESAITLIDAGQLYYRGQNVVELVRTRQVEDIAGFIWLDDLEIGRASLFSAPQSKLVKLTKTARTVARITRGFTPLERFQTILPIVAADDVAAYDRRPRSIARTGAGLLQALALVATGQDSFHETIAQTLQQGWVSKEPAAATLFNTALILCADHELNVSSFTARCVASAHATAYSVVLAGLAALQGVRHGGQTGQVEALLREVDTPKQARPVISDRLRRGESIPGFGHRLYLDGDPRAKLLMAQLGKAYARSPALTLAQSVVAQMRRIMGEHPTGEHPTIDFALVVLANVLKLPPGTAIALFALGRTIGWIGHAIEQYQADRLIRPRARYVGKMPG